MPVFLRWLLIDIIVMRILRRRRVAPYGRRAYPGVRGYGRPIVRRWSCCSGCLLLVVAGIVSIVLLSVLVHWAWQI